MLAPSPRSRFRPALLGLLATLLPAGALAGGFDVAPTSLVLAGKHRSALLTLANRSDQEIRFQVSASSWDETPDGERLQDPTEDLVVFPSLVAIAPGATRQIRVGTELPVGADEKSWRILVEEIPTPPEDGGVGVTFSTRMSIPVWLPPAQSVVVGGLGEVSQGDGDAEIDVHNEGTGHFRVRSLELVGRDAEGGETGRSTVAGWYVLAGHDRTFRVPLPAEACARTRSVDVRVVSPLGEWTSSAPWDPTRCEVGAAVASAR